MSNKTFTRLTLLGMVAVFCIAFSCSGCSAIKKIVNNAVVITKAATDSRSEIVSARTDTKDVHAEVAAAKKAVVENKPDVVTKHLDTIEQKTASVDKHLDAIDQHQVTIQHAAAEIQTESTGVVDKVPYWAVLLKWGLVAITTLGVIFVLWRLNAFLFIEAFIQKIATKIGTAFNFTVGA